MTSTLDRKTRLALGQAALAVAAQHPWRDVTIFSLAEAAGLDLMEVTGATPGDALDAVDEVLDQQMARGVRGVEPGMLVRDRLFDVLMRRFEAMEAHRAGLSSIEAAVGREPAQLALAHGRHVRSARWALALAGLEADGVAGAARAQGLAIILTQTRAAWREDDGGDFAKTMAALDKALRQAERTFGRFGGFEGAPADKAGSASPATAGPQDPPPLANGL